MEAPQVLLFIFSSDIAHHQPQHVYTYTHYYTATNSWKDVGVGLTGGWGIVSRGSGASFSYGIQPVQIASMMASSPCATSAYQSKYFNGVTNITTLQQYDPPSSFFVVLLILYVSCSSLLSSLD